MQDSQPEKSFYHTPNEDIFASTAISPENPPVEQSDEPDIDWVAPEFIQHDKSSAWYIGLLAITLALAASLYFILGGDIFAPVIVGILGLAFGIAASRKPRNLAYAIKGEDLLVENRHFKLDNFKSFTIVHENNTASLLLMPIKRFSTPLSLYVPGEKLDQVAQSVSTFLPVEEHQPGYVDKLLSRIRF